MKLSVAAGQLEIFGGVVSGMTRTAFFDGPGERYRYELGRRWDVTKPILVVCMLNPSMASHLIDDPTVLALIHFARLWGYGGLRIVNLYAFRSPSPKIMMATEDRMGPHNRNHLEDAMRQAVATTGRLLVAWGNDGDFEGEASWFTSRAVGVHRLEMLCLGKTQHGDPKHPMARGKHRIPRDQQPIIWRKWA